MNLNDKQKLAIQKVDDLISSDTEHELLITGQSGTGKSSVIKAIIEWINNKKLLAKLIGVDNPTSPAVILTASTNKAAAVLSELSNKPAMTIHKLLALRPRIDYETGDCTFKPSNDTHVFYNAVIIIDEMSFIDYSTYKIIKEQTSNCKIIWVGDHYQLKPIKSKYIPVYEHCKNTIELTEIMRNGGEIKRLGMELRKSIDTHVMPRLESIDNVTIMGKQDYLKSIDEAFIQGIDAKIIAWRNFSVTSYNKYIQNEILHKAELHIGDFYTVNSGIVGKSMNDFTTMVYLPTDSVVRLEKVKQVPDQDGILSVVVTNIVGETCHVQMYAEHGAKAQHLKATARDKNWKEHFEIKNNIVELRLPYSSTVNKAQGSTHEYVYLDLGDLTRCRNMDTFFRMLYVACTRASKELIIYDSKAE